LLVNKKRDISFKGEEEKRSKAFCQLFDYTKKKQKSLCKVSSFYSIQNYFGTHRFLARLL